MRDRGLPRICSPGSSRALPQPGTTRAPMPFCGRQLRVAVSSTLALVPGRRRLVLLPELWEVPAQLLPGGLGDGLGQISFDVAERLPLPLLRLAAGFEDRSGDRK